MRLRLTAMILLALALLPALTGCGRKGDLDRPSAATTNQKAAPGTPQTKDVVADKPFILDPLL